MQHTLKSRLACKISRTFLQDDFAGVHFGDLLGQSEFHLPAGLQSPGHQSVLSKAFEILQVARQIAAGTAAVTQSSRSEF